MSMEKEELRPIALDYLFEGMKLEEDIYNFDGKILLLAKNQILTDNTIEQLKHFNKNNRNISVSRNTYHALIKHGIEEENQVIQKKLENKVGYTKIEHAAKDLFKEAENTNMISKEDTDRIASEIQTAIRSIDPSLIFQCINSPKPIDEYLRRHSVNVSFINGLMGKWMGMTNEDIEMLILAGLVHDVGKTKIPTEILDSPYKLTVSEFEVIKMHPIYSYELLSKEGRFEESVKLAARHHHERLNGSGYPDGIDVSTISQFAKITAVSDIYDAMVSKRSYKKDNNPFYIISLLKNKSFSELDMNLIQVFANNMPFELVGKSVLLSDGSIGIVRFIVPNELEYPIVEVNGVTKQTSQELYCTSMIFDK